MGLAMTQEVFECSLIILPGRYDFHGLRELVKTSVLSLVSMCKCAAIADFGSMKFIAGSQKLLSRKLPNSPHDAEINVTVASYTPNYLYDRCNLLIIADKSAKDTVLSFVRELSKEIVDRGGRAKEVLTLVTEA